MHGRIYDLARRRPQALVAAAMLGVLAFLAASTVSSCVRKPAAPPTAPTNLRPPPPIGQPTDIPVEPTIRVRLMDATGDVTLSAAGPGALLADGKPVFDWPTALSAAAIRRDGRNWWLGNLHFSADSVRLEVLNEGAVTLAGRRYRGALALWPAADPRYFSVDNHVDLEHYLAGVLARELFSTWHLEAYKALAVAARTYALYEMQTTGRGRNFDVYADQRSQVYGGLADETPKSLSAVQQTWGQAMTFGPPGEERIFKTYYSSCCGGMTNPAEGLEPQAEGNIAPLAGGVQCHDCVAAPRYRWPAVRVKKSDAFTALARCYTAAALLDGLKEIRVAAATSWGRPQWVDVVGTGGQSVRIRADDLRLALLRCREAGAAGLYSINCTIRDEGQHLVFADGRGYGHGVGLCQYGAQGKALRGLRYHDILYSYYPGAHIKRLY